MASKQSTVDYIVDQAGSAGSVSAKKMFGEYGIYCEGKMVAIVGDDKLFVKPTAGGKTFVGEIEEASPYPGAKPCFLIDPERWDDAAWLGELIRISARELPAPKEKKKKPG
jgi:TfoX/Sxy family transcriptional regulator of competence genes